MSYWDDLEVEARELFERTAREMGAVPLAWADLHEDTREMYRRELVRRIGSIAITADNGRASNE